MKEYAVLWSSTEPTSRDTLPTALPGRRSYNRFNHHMAPQISRLLMAKLNVATPNNPMAVVRSLYLSLSILHASTHIHTLLNMFQLCTCEQLHKHARARIIQPLDLKRPKCTKKSAENTKTMYIYDRYISEKILLVYIFDDNQSKK